MQNKLVKHFFYRLKRRRKSARILKIVSLFVLFFLSSSSFAANGCGGGASFPSGLPPLPQLNIKPLNIGDTVPGSVVKYTFFSRNASTDKCRIYVNFGRSDPSNTSNGYQTVLNPVEFQNMGMSTERCGSDCNVYVVLDGAKPSSARITLSLVYVGPPKSGEFAVQMAGGARVTDPDSGAATYKWNINRPLKVENTCSVGTNQPSIDFGTIPSSQFNVPATGSALKRSIGIVVECGPGQPRNISFSLQPVGSTFAPSGCVLRPNNNPSIGIDLELGMKNTFVACDPSGKLEWPNPIDVGTRTVFTMNASLVQLSSDLPAGAFQAGLNWVADYK